MPSASPENIAKLVAVTTLVDDVRDTRTRLQQEVMAEVRKRLAEKERALENAVMDALSVFTVTDVARAYTPPGSTPNRNAIYEIKRRNAARNVMRVTTAPFEWVPRTMETVNGEITVYDIQAVFDNFGPANLNGLYTWSWDDRPVFELTGAQEPYPTTKYYNSMLEQWLTVNPYPGQH